MSAVTLEVTGRVARITLNRPERGNGITRSLVSELQRSVEGADLDPDVHVLLLSGNGKGFCGGYDLVESAEGQGGLGAEDPPAPRGSALDQRVIMANHDPSGVWDPMVDYAMMSRNVRAFMSLFHCSKPVVCKVHGFCVAGGTDMALCSDLLAQGLHATQTLGTLLDGIARHTKEGYAFQGLAAREGFRAAVRERDEPFGDHGATTFKG